MPLYVNGVLQPVKKPDARNRVLAIDPGAKLCGWAEFEKGRLRACGLVRTRMTTTGEQAVAFSKCFSYFTKGAHVIVERPEVYNQRNLKGDPNDLIGLALIGGAAAGAVCPAKLLTPLPKEWKGQVPKDIHHDRIINKLNAREIEALQQAESMSVEAMRKKIPKGLFHNVLDAVGIGLWYLKR